jgi:hypothetical protein
MLSSQSLHQGIAAATTDHAACSSYFGFYARLVALD